MRKLIAPAFFLALAVVLARFTARVAPYLVGTETLAEKERRGDEFSHRHFLAHGGAEFEPVCAGGVAGFAATAPESDTRGAKPLISFTISSS